MGRRHIEDVVVLLPGITGSVLQRDGKDATWTLPKKPSMTFTEPSRSLWLCVQCRAPARFSGDFVDGAYYANSQAAVL